MPKKNDKASKAKAKDKKKAPAKKKVVAKAAKKAAPKKAAKAPAKKSAAKAAKPSKAGKVPSGKAAAARKKTAAPKKPAAGKKAAAVPVAKKAASERPGKKGKVAAKAREIAEVDDTQELLTSAEENGEAAEEVVLTDADGRRYCRVKDCDQLATVDGYCRFHYLLYWKKIQIRKKILSEGKLERYIEELTARYPDKFLDMLRKDLRSEKEFLAAIQELEIDESAVDSEFEDETQNYIDEVRGMGEATSGREEEDF
jgi:hypothetical protein